MISDLTIRHFIFWRRVIPAENVRTDFWVHGPVSFEKLPNGSELRIPDWKIVSRGEQS